MFPEDSRTSVPDGTWAGLTSGFGVGPGVPRRSGRQNHLTMTVKRLKGLVGWLVLYGRIDGYTDRFIDRAVSFRVSFGFRFGLQRVFLWRGSFCAF